MIYYDKLIVNQYQLQIFAFEIDFQRSAMMYNSKHLSGRVAWVTGSSRGIGQAIARRLAAAGATVVIHGTSPTSTRSLNEGESLQAVADDIAEEHGTTVYPVHGDLTNHEVVDRIVGEIHTQCKQIDILITCAGGDIGSKGLKAPMAGKPESNDGVFVSLEDIRTVIDRNLMTCILCCRAAAPEMMERKEGRIVNMGSIAGAVGIPQSVIYATSKAAVHEYTRCLAAQLRPYNVKVNAVAPGSITSPRFLKSRPIDESMMPGDETLVRYGDPDEVAQVVEFLVSEQAGYVSGQILRIDGGEQIWAI
jgi:3-oxoacyl-[acyl-carrier protein] reductase